MSRIASPLADTQNQLKGVSRTERLKASRLPLKREKRLKVVSERRKVTGKIYRELRDGFLREHSVCEYPDCSAPSFDCHHRNGRTGKNYLDTATWSALCRKHHRWIHEHPNKARALGLLA